MGVEEATLVCQLASVVSPKGVAVTGAAGKAEVAQAAEATEVVGPEVAAMVAAELVVAGSAMVSWVVVAEEERAG